MERAQEGGLNRAALRRNLAGELQSRDSEPPPPARAERFSKSNPDGKW